MRSRSISLAVALGAVALVLALVAGLAACGGSSATATSSADAHRTSAHVHRPALPAGPLTLHYRHLYALAAPLRDPAYAPIGHGDFALVGGLDSADVSTSEVDLGGLRSTSQVASLGVPQHDAQAATLGGRVYVFGGGSATELSHIVAVDPRTHTVSTVGALPTASSDSSVTSVGGSAYIVGGYDGSAWLDTVLAWHPGQSRPTVIAHLPLGLRYAAVTAADGRIIVIGGTTSSGVSNQVFSVDPATGQVRSLATLSAPVCHGEAVTLGRWVYLVGGRGDSDTSQTASILAINPTSGKVVVAGRLPVGLSDAALIPVSGGALIIGGLEASGAVNANVGELVGAAA